MVTSHSVFLVYLQSTELFSCRSKNLVTAGWHSVNSLFNEVFGFSSTSNSRKRSEWKSTNEESVQKLENDFYRKFRLYSWNVKKKKIQHKLYRVHLNASQQKQLWCHTDTLSTHSWTLRGGGGRGTTSPGPQNKHWFCTVLRAEYCTEYILSGYCTHILRNRISGTCKELVRVQKSEFPSFLRKSQNSQIKVAIFFN